MPDTSSGRRCRCPPEHCRSSRASAFIAAFIRRFRAAAPCRARSDAHLFGRAREKTSLPALGTSKHQIPQSPSECAKFARGKASARVTGCRQPGESRGPGLQGYSTMGPGGAGFRGPRLMVFRSELQAVCAVKTPRGRPDGQPRPAAERRAAISAPARPSTARPMRDVEGSARERPAFQARRRAVLRPPPCRCSPLVGATKLRGAAAWEQGRAAAASPRPYAPRHQRPGITRARPEPRPAARKLASGAQIPADTERSHCSIGEAGRDHARPGRTGPPAPVSRPRRRASASAHRSHCARAGQRAVPCRWVRPTSQPGATRPLRQRAAYQSHGVMESAEIVGRQAGRSFTAPSAARPRVVPGCSSSNGNARRKHARQESPAVQSSAPPVNDAMIACRRPHRSCPACRLKPRRAGHYGAGSSSG